MDNVTHALAGSLLAAGAIALVERRTGDATPGFRRAAYVTGIVAAELPDADLLYAGPMLGMGKLGYMLHHRGHTHTLLFALVGAALLWWAVTRLRPGLRESIQARALLWLAMLGTLSHIALDFTNSYGVHPFWPVVNRWFYGDAVFIVEPWLWIASIPTLVLLARGRIARTGLSLLLVLILVAAWQVSMVGQAVAAILTAGAALWFALVRLAPRSRRVGLALGAWLGIEAIFFASSAAAESAVSRATGASFRDAVLTPAVSNPFCVRAIVVEEDAGAYRASRATVAPFAGIVPVARCAAANADADADGGPTGTSPSRQGSDRVRWGRSWERPAEEFRALWREGCQTRAAMQFIRVPLWEPVEGDRVALTDWRYGENADGFAGVVVDRGNVDCPGLVPGWDPPRGDILR